LSYGGEDAAWAAISGVARLERG